MKKCEYNGRHGGLVRATITARGEKKLICRLHYQEIRGIEYLAWRCPNCSRTLYSHAGKKTHLQNCYEKGGKANE